MCSEKHAGENCIAEIINVIDILQKNACPNNCLDSCDRPTLGGGPSCLVCNTRPIQLFTCCGNGVPFSMPVCKDNVEACSNVEEIMPSNECSSVFRVEKIEGNCTTFRVLVPNHGPDSCNMPFLATNSFFTMDLGCVCAVRCLNDTFVECV